MYVKHVTHQRRQHPKIENLVSEGASAGKGSQNREQPFLPPSPQRCRGSFVHPVAPSQPAGPCDSPARRRRLAVSRFLPGHPEPRGTDDDARYCSEFQVSSSPRTRARRGRAGVGIGFEEILLPFALERLDVSWVAIVRLRSAGVRSGYSEARDRRFHGEGFVSVRRVSTLIFLPIFTARRVENRGWKRPARRAPSDIPAPESRPCEGVPSDGPHPPLFSARGPWPPPLPSG